MGIVTMTAVRYWASLTTNRKLLAGLLKVYMVAHILIFMFALWCACVLFLMFSDIKDWGVSVITMQCNMVGLIHNLFLSVLCVYFRKQ